MRRRSGSPGSSGLDSFREPGGATPTPPDTYFSLNLSEQQSPPAPRSRFPERPRPETDPRQPPSAEEAAEGRGAARAGAVGACVPAPRPAQQVRPGPTSPARPRLLTPTKFCDPAAGSEATSAGSAAPSKPPPPGPRPSPPSSPPPPPPPRRASALTHTAVAAHALRRAGVT